MSKNESKHTPGPWVVVATPHGGGTARNIYPMSHAHSGERVLQSHRVANVQGDPRKAEVNEANARLIAAAPAMYEALRKAESAISEELCSYGPEEIEGNPILEGHQEALDAVRAALAQAEGGQA